MSRQKLLSCLLACSLAVFAGCAFDNKGVNASPTPGEPIGGGGGEGGGPVVPKPIFDSGTREGGTMSGIPDGGFTPTADANCGLTTDKLISSPADVLIVLDRSGSMNENSMGMGCGNAGCGAASKWTQVTLAINEAVAQTDTTVNWGLKLFGSSTGCTVNAGIEVAPAPMNASAVIAAIAATGPGSTTPTRAGIAAASAFLASVNNPNPKYIILATDGLPNCPMTGNNNNPDEAGAIAAALASNAAGIPVFVIGIATNAAAEATMNAMAVGGGRPRAGAQQYYAVASTAELVAVLNTLQGMIARGCTYTLAKVPPTPDNVKVTVGGNKIERDTTRTGGWDYSPDMTSITFHGALCDDLKTGGGGEVAIILGCGKDPIP